MQDARRLTIVQGRRFHTLGVLSPIALIALLFGVVVVTLVVTTRETDRRALEVATQLVRNLLDAQGDAIATKVRDYSYWTEAFERTHLKFDRAFAEENYGTYLDATLDIDASLVLAPGDRTLFAMSRGSVVAPGQGLPIEPSLRALIDATRADDVSAPPRSGLVRTPWGIAVAAVDAIVPQDDAFRLPGAQRTLLVLVDLLERSVLQRFSDIYLTQPLSLIRPEDVPELPDTLAKQPLMAQDGEVLGALAWSPEQPGTMILRTAMVPLTGIAFVFVIIAFAAVRTLDKTARDLALSEERARYESLHDALTALPNRQHFKVRLAQVLDQPSREGLGPALLTLDLDGFKAVNDSHGHAKGDLLLQLVARRLSTRLRPGDMLARMGGDEFSILQVEGEQPRASELLASRIVDALGEPFLLNDTTVSIGVSIGIAFAASEPSDEVSLTMRADVALYAAKAAGRNTWRCFEVGMHSQIQRRRSIEAGLKLALGLESIDVHYQPQFDLRDGRLIGFEALARWTHPELGPVGPAEFVAIAESSGLMAQLGTAVLQRACRDAATWPGLRVAVNVSPQQIFRSDVVATVQRALERSSLPPHLLEIEITESALLDDPVVAPQVLRRLRELGVSLAIDDFGTGYSNLGQLHLLPLDRLKVARPFVEHSTRDAAGLTVLRNILALARGLNLETVAEGIETPEQLRILEVERATIGQGYLLGRPASGGELARRFARGTVASEFHLADAPRSERAPVLVGAV